MFPTRPGATPPPEWCHRSHNDDSVNDEATTSQLSCFLSSYGQRARHLAGAFAFSSWNQGRTTITPPVWFIGFRELISACGHALLQLF
jgi:hypothetical protein